MGFIFYVHFEPEMWQETRQDGSRKLQLSAVPSIFAFSKEKLKRKAPARRDFLFDENCAPVFQIYLDVSQESEISAFSSKINMDAWQITSIENSVDVEPEQQYSSSRSESRIK